MGNEIEVLSSLVINRINGNFIKLKADTIK
jgi:hypothetical protein